ncbi:MAG: hypothetical protein ACI9F2_000323 [Lysobacterales bacterium]|jgi:hypothetical protein
MYIKKLSQLLVLYYIYAILSLLAVFVLWLTRIIIIMRTHMKEKQQYTSKQKSILDILINKVLSTLQLCPAPVYIKQKSLKNTHKR